MFAFSEHDHILTAYAESASGPGWGNTPIWVVIRSRLDGAIRLECIQPQEQSAEMQVLYRVSHAAHEAMTHWVRRAAESAVLEIVAARDAQKKETG